MNINKLPSRLFLSDFHMQPGGMVDEMDDAWLVSMSPDATNSDATKPRAAAAVPHSWSVVIGESQVPLFFRWYCTVASATGTRLQTSVRASLFDLREATNARECARSMASPADHTTSQDKSRVVARPKEEQVCPRTPAANVGFNGQCE